MSESFFQYHMFVCTNERPADHPFGSCSSSGSEPLLDYLRSELTRRQLKTGIRAQKAGCLGRCNLGPLLVVYPQGIWYGIKTKADIDQIIDSHIVGGQIVEALQVPAA